MSLFMAGGEMAFTIGPLLAVWVVSIWTLDGFWRTVFLGWAATVVLFLAFARCSTAHGKTGKLALHWRLRCCVCFCRCRFLLFFDSLCSRVSRPICPRIWNGTGVSLILAGAMFSVVQLAGVGGVLLSGPAQRQAGEEMGAVRGNTWLVDY